MFVFEIYNSFCSYEDNAKDLNEKLKCVLIATNDSDFNVQTRYLLTVWQNTALLNYDLIILRRLNHNVQVGEPFETTCSRKIRFFSTIQKYIDYY